MRSARLVLPFVLVALFPGIAHAQKQGKAPRNSGYDSTYVLDYTHIITGRTYLSTKSNAFQLLDRETAEDLLYRPNNRVNLGVGASYRSYTLNIGIGFGFLNRDAQDKGETDYLDAQINYFSRHFATNVFFQVYQGYYLDSYTTAQLNWPNTVTRPFRSDIRQANAGFSSLYIFNNERFSYRAAFNQDAWQRRSAGSLLAGAYLPYYSVNGDSTLMPTVLSSRFDPSLNFDRASYFDFGAMGGYAHTFVVHEHWFMTVSGALGIGGSLYNASPEPVEGGTSRGRLHPGYHGQLRSAGGYNSRSICAAVSFNVETIMNSMGGSEAFQWTVGNLRFTVAKRFNRRLKTMDRVIKNVTGE